MKSSKSFLSNQDISGLCLVHIGTIFDNIFDSFSLSCQKVFTISLIGQFNMREVSRENLFTRTILGQCLDHSRVQFDSFYILNLCFYLSKSFGILLTEQLLSKGHIHGIKKVCNHFRAMFHGAPSY